MGDGLSEQRGVCVCTVCTCVCTCVHAFPPMCVQPVTENMGENMHCAQMCVRECVYMCACVHHQETFSGQVCLVWIFSGWGLVLGSVSRSSYGHCLPVHLTGVGVPLTHTAQGRARPFFLGSLPGAMQERPGWAESGGDLATTWPTPQTHPDYIGYMNPLCIMSLLWSSFVLDVSRFPK